MWYFQKFSPTAKFFRQIDSQHNSSEKVNLTKFLQKNRGGKIYKLFTKYLTVTHTLFDKKIREFTKELISRNIIGFTKFSAFTEK